MTMNVLETERLSLRRLTPDDAPFMLELVTDPSWIEFIGDRGLKTVDDARAYIVDRYVADYERHGFGLYLVALRETGESLGICGLIKRESLEDVDVGFAFLPRHVGRGYATEAAAASLEHGWRDLGLRRIVAITVPNNLRSIGVLEKVGLRFEKTIRMPGDEEELALYSVDRARE
ncbi:MAG TPA: GNAT family N-acetyltransferase [Candidatus Eisenbacteria bacterium]|nr:GNAT family N-acetyltransferase [Candidatus Eisenbacteria bacterium]